MIVSDYIICKSNYCLIARPSRFLKDRTLVIDNDYPPIKKLSEINTALPIILRSGTVVTRELLYKIKK